MEDPESLPRPILRRPGQPRPASRHSTRTLRRLVRFSTAPIAPSMRGRSITENSENSEAAGTPRSSKRVTNPTAKAVEARPTNPTRRRSGETVFSASTTAAKGKAKHKGPQRQIQQPNQRLCPLPHLSWQTPWIIKGVSPCGKESLKNALDPFK